MDRLFAGDDFRPVTLDGSLPALRPCRWCKADAGYVLPPKGPHGEGVRCAECERHLGYLPKRRQTEAADDFDLIERGE